MDWDNYGTVWVIDHVHPLCSFRFTEHDNEFKECFKLENLQPLFVEENIHKGRKDGGAYVNL